MDVHGAINYGRERPAFYSDPVLFDLPPVSRTPRSRLNSYVADDSSVVYLNGAELSNTGIGGPGSGFFSFDGLTTEPYNFINGNGSASFGTLVDPVSLLTVGPNVLAFYVNNTNAGIGAGFPSGGPTQYASMQQLPMTLPPFPARAAGL